MVYEGGNLLAETERFPDGPRRSVAAEEPAERRHLMLSKLNAFFNEHYRRVDPRWLGLFRICFGCLLP